MPKVLELKEIGGKLGVILDMPGNVAGSVSLWTEEEAAKQAKDSEALGIIMGLKEALEIVEKTAPDVVGPRTEGAAIFSREVVSAISSRISILEGE